MHKKYLESLYILTKPILQKRLYRSGVRCYTLIIKGKENKTMTTEMEWGATIEDLLNEVGITEEELNDEESV